MSSIHPDQLRDERLIIWVEDIMHAPYVRELLASTVASRTWWPSQGDHPGEVVGFAALGADAQPAGPPRHFARRIFWLDDEDRRAHRSRRLVPGNIPADAVHPCSVLPRLPGRHPTEEGSEYPARDERPPLTRQDRAAPTRTLWEVGTRLETGTPITKVVVRTCRGAVGRVLRRRHFLLRDNCIFAIKACRQRRSGSPQAPEMLSNFYFSFNPNEIVGLVHGEYVPLVSGVLHVNHNGTMLEFPFQMSLSQLHNNGRLVERLGAHAAGHLILASRDAGLIRDISLRLAGLDL